MFAFRIASSSIFILLTRSAAFEVLLDRLFRENWPKIIATWSFRVGWLDNFWLFYLAAGNNITDWLTMFAKKRIQVKHQIEWNEADGQISFIWGNHNNGNEAIYNLRFPKTDSPVSCRGNDRSFPDIKLRYLYSFIKWRLTGKQLLGYFRNLDKLCLIFQNCSENWNRTLKNNISNAFIEAQMLRVFIGLLRFVWYNLLSEVKAIYDHNKAVNVAFMVVQASE